MNMVSYLNRDKKPSSDLKMVEDRILKEVGVLTAGGNEPSARGTIAGWADNPLAHALVLLKKNKKLWLKLSKVQQEKLDFLMQCMVVAGNYCQNYKN